jgi:hypothetical protein
LAKAAIYDYSTTAASNTDIDGVDSTGATGLVKSGDNYTRSVMAHAKGFANDLGAVNTVGGTADAITVTLSSSPSALVDGMRITINASAANTGATTLNVSPAVGSAFGAKKVMKWSAGSEAELSANDIPAANALIELIYDSARNAAAGAWMLLGTSVAAATTTAAGIVKLATLARTLAGTVTDEAVPPAYLYFPTGHLYGLGMANGTDATNDINFSAGTCRDSSDSQNIIATAKVKQLDANWAAGTNQGGRYSGAAITNTTYHCYAVAKALGADPDFYFDPSATEATVLGHLQAETGGADYLYVRRIGSIIRASATILAFDQFGDTFVLDSPVLDASVASSGTTAVTLALSVPLGVVVEAFVNTLVSSGIYLSSLVSTDLATSETVSPLLSTFDSANANGAQVTKIFTNTSAQIRYRAHSNAVVRIATLGWVDRRGRT